MIRPIFRQMGKLELSVKLCRIRTLHFETHFLKRISRELFYKMYSDKRKLLENVIQIQIILSIYKWSFFHKKYFITFAYIHDHGSVVYTHLVIQLRIINFR